MRTNFIPLRRNKMLHNSKFLKLFITYYDSTMTKKPDTTTTRVAY